ncbi:MAG TPA: hypothetical protein ENI23_10525 [bacterium]|nr:hypothetical protein [bacterium]
MAESRVPKPPDNYPSHTKMVERGLIIFRKISLKSGRRHSRNHIETGDWHAKAVSYLENVCNGCQHLLIDFIQKDGRERAALRCAEGISPVENARRFDPPFDIPTEEDCTERTPFPEHNVQS